MGKKTLILAVALLLVVSTGLLAGCAQSEPGYEMINSKVVMEHDYGIRYTNCFACHAGGLHPVPEAYRAMPIEVCTGACHIEEGAPTSTTTIPPTDTGTGGTGTTTIPPTDTGTGGTTDTGTGEPTGTVEPPVIGSHGAGPGYDGWCLFCHGPGSGDIEFPIGGPNDHTDRTSDQCYDCHKVAQ